MTVRHVTIQGCLALAALILAYTTWQRSPDFGNDEVTIADFGKNEIQSVRFDDTEKSTWVELARDTDASGAFVAVRLGPQDKTPARKPDAGAPANPADQKTPERLLRGSDNADKLLDRLAPLRGSRGLGILDAAKLKELGLESPGKRITVRLRSGQREFAIAPAPPGGGDPYLRDEANGQVYVVNRSLLSDFQTASSLLVERHLHAFRMDELDRIAISQGSRKLELAVLRGENGVQLAPAGSPDKPDATAKTWNDRAFSLWPSEILGKDETPTEGAPQVSLRVDYGLRGRALGFVEIAKVPSVSSNAEGNKDLLFARSERTLGWFKLGSDAQNLLADADKLLK